MKIKILKIKILMKFSNKLKINSIRIFFNLKIKTITIFIIIKMNSITKSTDIIKITKTKIPNIFNKKIIIKNLTLILK